METPWAYMLRAYRSKYPDLSITRARHSLNYALAYRYATTHGLPRDSESLTDIIEEDDTFKAALRKLKRKHRGRSR